MRAGCPRHPGAEAVSLPDAPAPGVTTFEGRAAFQEALRRAFAALAQSDCREVWLCDRDFAAWPLGEAATISQLSQWAFSHRRLTVIAAVFNEIERQHPRWVAWRRQWDHVVSCRCADAADADALPSFFIAPQVLGVSLRDNVLFRGTSTCDPPEIARLRSQIDAHLQRSHDAFPATRLGL